MSFLVQWLKKYWLVSFAALAVGVFTLLPSLYFFQKAGDSFKGVYPFFSADTLYYQARVHEISDGHSELNHPYFFEHKNETYPQATGAEKFIYVLTKIFNATAPGLQIFFDFVFPVLIFVLTYFLFRKFSSNKYLAVFLPALLYTIVMGGIFKPVNPQITFPLLLLFLLSWTSLILNNNKKLLRASICGLFLGLLFLTYFYHWSFVVVVVGIYVLILLFRKKFRQAWYHIFAGLCAIVIGLPYFIRVIQGMNAPFSSETAVRIGMYFSHMPESLPRIAIAIFALVFFVLFARVYKIQSDKRYLIVLSLLGANVIYPNHQIISGIIIENAVHWSWMPVFIYCLSASYMFEVLQDKKRNFKNNVWIFFIVAAIFVIPAWRLGTFTWKPYLNKYITKEAIERQYYADVFDWINKNTSKDDVILSDRQMMRFIPAYTHANVYNTLYAYNLPSSDKEVIERYLLANFFNPNAIEEKNFALSSGERILWAFPNESEKSTHTFFRGWSFGVKRVFEEQYSFDKELAKVRSVYESLSQDGWDVSLLKKYRLDYIIWDKNAVLDWNIDDYNDLEVVERIGNVVIYKFKASDSIK